MKLATLAQLPTAGSIPLLFTLATRLVTPLYRAAFLAGASMSGTLRRLSVGPCDVHTLAEEIGISDQHERLRTWLEFGVRLGELAVDNDRYRLRSRTATALARAHNDAVAAGLEEVVLFHLPALLHAPAMLRDGHRLTLADQDGSVIARSSLVVRPFVLEAVERVLDRSSAVRLLDIGCGSGEYARHAAIYHPRLTAIAIELQPELAFTAAANIAEAGLAERVEVRHADIRALELEPQFDLITMHNNIYYFPLDERTEVLAHARSLLAPHGRLLLTTSCRGGNLTTQALNLWFALADFAGPLPDQDELLAQLRAAGFGDVQRRRLIPGDTFCSFTATNSSVTPAATTQERLG